MGQTVFDLNNWWMAERTMLRAIIDRTEQVRGVHFTSHAQHVRYSREAKGQSHD